MFIAPLLLSCFMLLCLGGSVWGLTFISGAVDWVTKYGGLTLTITGLVGVGSIIFSYPQWVMREVLVQPVLVLARVVKRVISRRRSNDLGVAAGEGRALLEESHVAEVVRGGSSNALDAVEGGIEAETVVESRV